MDLFNLSVAICLMLLIGNVRSDCSVDPSAPEKEIVTNAIKLLDPIKNSKSEVPATDGKSYHLGICTNAVPQFDSSAIVMSEGKLQTVVGLYNRTLAVTGNNWVEYSFPSYTKYPNTSSCFGKNMSARILISCDDKITSSSLSLTLLSSWANDCFTTFTADHKLACLHPRPEDSMGGFSIFLLLVFIGFVVYFTGGFCYLRFVKKAQGTNQIPHRDFWFRFGNGFADLVSMICRCDRHVGGTAPVGGSDYDAVGGSSSYEEEYGSSGTYQTTGREPIVNSGAQPLTQPDANLILP